MQGLVVNLRPLYLVVGLRRHHRLLRLRPRPPLAEVDRVRLAALPGVG